MDDINNQLKSSMYSEITPFVIELEGRGAVCVKGDSVYELTRFDGSKVQVTGLVSQNGISFFPMSSDIIQTDDMFIEQPFLINVAVENQSNQFVLDEEAVAVPPEDVVPSKEFHQIDGYENVDNVNAEIEPFPGFESNVSILEFVDPPESKVKPETPSVIQKQTSRDIVCEVTPVDLLSTFLVDTTKSDDKEKTEKNELSVLKSVSNNNKDVSDKFFESSQENGEEHLETENKSELPSISPMTNKRGRPKKEKDVDPPLRKGPFYCDICRAKVSTWTQLKAHKVIHVEENKPYVCKVCCMSFNVEKNLNLHMLLHNVGNLTCPECNKTFTRFASFKAHLPVHEEEENVFCSECGDEFTSNLQLEQHLQEHRNEWEKSLSNKAEAKNALTCKACNRIFTNPISFEYHKKDHQRLRSQLLALAPKRKKKRFRGGSRYKYGNECKVCKKTFPKPSQLVRHIRIHTGEKPFQCTVCSAAFSQKGSLQIHMSKHNGYKPHVCSCCSLSFSQRGNLITHVNKVHRIPKEGEEIYKCVKCPCSFKKLASLNCHVTRFHIGVKNAPGKSEAENVNDVDTLLSQIADLRSSLTNTSDMDILQTAIRISGLPVSVKSNEDGSDSIKENVPIENLFAEQSVEQNDTSSEVRIVTIADKADDGNVKHYTVRQRRVGNVRWHQCNVCQKEFKKPSDLIRHMRIHTREKPFRCNQCFRTFSIKSTLKSHIRTHQSSKLHECKTCGKKVSSSSMKIHQRSHAGIRPFNCSICTKSFTTSGQLKTHLSTNAHKHRAENCGGEVEAVNNNYFFEEPFLIVGDGEFRQQLSRKEKLITRSQNASSAERPHECEYCHLKFRKSSHLKQHKLQHTGEKPFSCSVCHKNFTTNGVLKMHLKTHSGQKDFECNRCTSKFSTKGSLNRHVQTFHSAERPYMCPYCQKRFKTSVNCRKHIKIHRYDNNQQFFGMKLEEMYSEQTGRVLTEQSENLAADVDDGETYKPEEQTETITQTILADSTGTITLPSLTPEPLTQESIRELEQTLNHQLFGTGQGSEYTVQMISSVDDEMRKDADFIETSLGPKTLILNVDDTIGESSIVQTVFSQADELQTVSNMSDILPDTKEDFAKEDDDDDDPKDEESKENELVDEVDEISGHACNICGKTFTSAQALKVHGKVHVTGKKEYSCDLCGWSTLTRSSLRRHANIHSEEKKFACSQCPAKFRLELHLRRHLKLHEEDSKEAATPRVGRRSKGPFKELTEAETEILAAQDVRHGASVSEKILIASAAEKLRIDEKRKSEPQPEEARANFGNDCKYCLKSFKKPSDLIRHIRVHTGERPFQCSQCHKCFTVKSTLQSHLRTHYDLKTVSCHICQSMFAAKSSLKVHMRLHTGAKPFECDICGQKFRTSGHRKNHLLTHAKNKPRNWKKQQLQMLNKIAVALVDDLNEQAQAEKGSEAKDKPDEEAGLQQVFENEDDVAIQNAADNDALLLQLNDHNSIVQLLSGEHEVPAVEDENAQQPVRFHIYTTDGQMFITRQDPDLVVCPTTTTTTAAATEDIAGAEKEKPSKTGFETVQQQHQEVEEVSGAVVERVADGELTKKSITCKYCGKMFLKKSLAERHIRIHTGERPFSCELCGKRFTQSNALEAHLKAHRGERAYSCPYCEFSCVQKGNLRLHISRTHQATTFFMEEDEKSKSKEVRSLLSDSLLTNPDKSPTCVRSSDLDQVMGELFPQVT